ncbi:MAG: Hsp20/alpha crystallin family protein, partial [Proteobacteria bacterium]
YYELTAKVAPHEKDNVQVRVRDGKVTLSAARKFEQSFEDKGVRASTNSQQTFRQEFKLDKPADTKHVVTQISEDGSIRALIPKKGFGRPKI